MTVQVWVQELLRMKMYSRRGRGEVPQLVYVRTVLNDYNKKSTVYRNMFMETVHGGGVTNLWGGSASVTGCRTSGVSKQG